MAADRFRPLLGDNRGLGRPRPASHGAGRVELDRLLALCRSGQPDEPMYAVSELPADQTAALAELAEALATWAGEDAAARWQDAARVLADATGERPLDDVELSELASFIGRRLLAASASPDSWLQSGRVDLARQRSDRYAVRHVTKLLARRRSSPEPLTVTSQEGTTRTMGLLSQKARAAALLETCRGNRSDEHGPLSPGNVLPVAVLAGRHGRSLLRHAEPIR